MRLDSDGVLDAVGEVLAEVLAEARKDYAARLEAIDKRLADLRDGAPGAPGDPGPPGEPGPPGLDGTSLIPCGKWQDGAEYHRGDIVGWDGASWIARRKTVAGEIPGASGAFMIVAARGKDGKPGKDARPAKDGEPGAPGRDAAKLLEIRLTGTDLAFAFDDGAVLKTSFAPLLDLLRAEIAEAVKRAAP